MREILFRGKRLDNGEWVEGSLLKVTLNGKTAHLIFGDNFSFDGNDVKALSHALVDPETIGQYTGLKDKNGKRIFEGDVCRFREWSRGDMCWVGKVHWEHQQFVISGGANKECYTGFTLRMSRFISNDIEVIGTIHDNPEPLEVQE